jgi:ATP-dependent Clp protease ATP-binding subunit ClpX
MYELPTQGNIKRVVLDEAAIDGQGKPLLVYADEADQQSPVASASVRDAAA